MCNKFRSPCIHTLNGLRGTQAAALRGAAESARRLLADEMLVLSEAQAALASSPSP